MTHVLIVDDEPSIRETFQAFLEEDGYDVSTAADLSDAESFLAEQACDVILTSTLLPGDSCLALLQRVFEIDENISVIIITAESDVSTAAEMVRHGAYDYIPKPVPRQMLSRVVGLAAEKKRLLDDKRRLAAENRAYQARLEERVIKHTAELEQHNQELAALIETISDVSATLDLTQVLKRVAQRAARVCGAHRCTILLLAEDGKMLTPLMSQFSDGHIDRKMWQVFQEAGYSALVESIPEVQQIIREQCPLFIPDVTTSSLPRRWLEPFGVKSVLLVPLISKERAIGLMGFDHIVKDQDFTAGQIGLATAIAAQAAVAIENACLFDKERNSRRLADTLREVAQALNSTLSLDQVLGLILTELEQVIPLDSGSIMLLEDGDLIIRAVRGFADPDSVLGARLNLQTTLLNRQVVESKRPLIIGSVHEDERWLKATRISNMEFELRDTRSWMGIPLIAKGQVIGMLTTDKHEAHFYREKDAQVALTFANQAAVAIENARLFETTSRHAAELEAIHQASLHLTASLELQPLLEMILEHVLQLTSADDAHVFLYDGERLTFGAAMWASDHHQEPYAEPRPHGLTYTVAHSGERIVIPDVKKHPLFQNGKWPDWNGAIVSIPLHLGGRVQGVMNVAFNTPRSFSKRELLALDLFADQAAIAIKNAQLFAAEQRQRREAETLYRAAQSLATTTLNLSQVFERILSELEQVVPYDSASVQLLRSGHLEIIGGHGFPNLDELLGITFDLSQEDNPNRKVVRQRASFIVDNAPAVYPEFRRGPHAAAGIHSWMGVPLLFGDQLIGMLALDKREPNFYTPEHARLVEAFAAQAAIAIENARLYDAAQSEIAERKQAEQALQKRAARLELIARVGQRTTSILELDDLLGQAANLIGDAFEYYNVNIFLVEGDEIALRASTFPTYRPSEKLVRLRVGAEGITGWVAANGEPLLVPDVSVEPRYRTTLKGIETKAELAVPIKLKNTVIGVLDAQSTQLDAFSQDDLFTLQTIADQLAIAIENARLYEATRRHLDEFVALHNIDIAITSVLDQDQVLRIVYEQVNEVMDISTFLIGLYDEKKKELDMALVMEQGKHISIPTLKIGKNDGLSGLVLRTRQPLWVEDIERATLPVKPLTKGEQPRSLMMWPLITRNKVIGVISAQSTAPHAFDNDHRRLFSGIASQVAIAVENARLFKEITSRLHDVSLLHDVALIGAASLNFDEILHRTVEAVRDRLQLDVFGFLLLDEKTDMIRLHPAFLGVPDEMTDFSIPPGDGIIGWVAQTGQPILAPDVSKEPRYLNAIPDIRSEVCVPLKIGNKVIGVIDAESTKINAFSDDDLRLFSTLASQLSVVLENAHLFEETKRRLDEARLIQEVVLAAASTLDFDLVLERAVKALNRTLGVYRLGFLLPDEQQGILASHPSLTGFAETVFQVPLENSLAGRAYRTGQPILVPDTTEESTGQEIAPDTRSALAVPVRIGDHIVAVLYAESPQPGAFGKDERRFFTTIAGQLGVALENARLYQKLEAQTAELTRAYSELQEMDRLRTELVQNVGHELRTPLGIIKGYVELLLNDDLGPIPQDQRAALEIINRRTTTLTRLIHNLTVLQTFRKELSLIPISLVEIIQHVLIEFRGSAKKAGLTLCEELPQELPPMMGDEEQLELAFGHLLDNAIKFSPDGGIVTIRAWTDAGMANLSISDEGIGISPDHLDRVFERFYQVDGSARRRFGGMGVGLALVWEIIQAHGGTVQVESNVGKGSKFTVALPLATPDPREEIVPDDR